MSRFFFLFEKTVLETPFIPYSLSALCRYTWVEKLQGLADFQPLLPPKGGSGCFKRCCFLQLTAASSSRARMAASHLCCHWFPFQENETASMEDRGISLFLSIEGWYRMKMKHCSTMPVLSTNLFSLPSHLLLHCEPTDQVPHFSVRWSLFYASPQETR